MSLAELNRSDLQRSAANDFNFIAKAILACRGKHYEMQRWGHEFAASARSRDVLKAGVLGPIAFNVRSVGPVFGTR
jgi:hypothetical protein